LFLHLLPLLLLLLAVRSSRKSQKAPKKRHRAQAGMKIKIICSESMMEVKLKRF